MCVLVVAVCRCRGAVVLGESVGIAECLWSCGGAEGWYGSVVCADSVFDYVVNVVAPCKAGLAEVV